MKKKKTENGYRRKSKLLQARDLVYEIVFPTHCIICDDLMEQGQGQIHRNCKNMLFPVCGAVCMHCGRPVASEKEEFCYDCSRKETACNLQAKGTFRQGKSLYLYRGEIKQTMYRFKYGNKREYASYFAGQTVEKYGRWLEKIGVDAIIPVPMYKKKEKRRGYNQAAVFARALTEAIRVSENTGPDAENKSRKIPVYDPGAVLRVRNTRPMKELNDIERKNNLENAFQTTENIVKYRKVLLVDDIYTTGSTADAVSKELLAAGVQEVYFLSICIGKGV